MLSRIEIIEDAKDAIMEKLAEIYNARGEYNTDILIKENGTVDTHDYFENCSYPETANIIAVYRVTANDIAVAIDATAEEKTDEDGEVIETTYHEWSGGDFREEVEEWLDQKKWEEELN